MRAELRSAAGRTCVRLARPVRTVRSGVALTFDDGPDPRSTPAVLDLLAAAGVRATFFLVGQRAAAHPALVERTARDGHAIGSHSWSHPVPWRTSAVDLLRDYRRGHEAVQQALGGATRLFRPPHGHLGPASTAAVRLLRLRPVLWTHDPEDWRAGVGAADLRRRLADVCDGGVVLLHDALVRPPAEAGLPEGSDDERTETLLALPGLLADLRTAGLSPTTVQLAP